MKLNKFGELVAETGFDGGEYMPRYASRTSVYLGDMTREDLRVKKEVSQRATSAKKQDIQAAEIKRRLLQEKIITKSKMHQLIADREARANQQIEKVKAHRFLAAKRSSRVTDVNPWIGNPFAGFGQEGEVRIDPDANEAVEIVDANIPSVKEYGINNWMEDTSYYDDKVESGENSYTPGKRILQTMVDYARTAEESLVGVAVAKLPENQAQIQTATAYAESVGQTVATAVEAPSNTLKYGLMALAAWMLLKK